MNYRYSVITFEHDLYANPARHADVQMAAREYLQGHGYQLVVSNVYAPKPKPSPFEDWFVDPTVIDPEIFSPFIADSVRPETLLV
jgi:hypothetical protein